MDTYTDSQEMICLVALREARATLLVDLAAHADAHGSEDVRDPDGRISRETLELVQSDAAEQISELFFVLQELGLNEGAMIRAYLEQHTAAMNDLLADPDKMRARGLTAQRIKAARFSPAQIEFIELVSLPGQLRLDQSALGRLLSELMSPETCRKVVIALSECGFLDRHNVGQALISSRGVLEQIYRMHLAKIVTNVRQSP